MLILNKKKSKMATLTLQKVDFRAKNIPRNKKGHNDKGVILQENVIILKNYATNKRTSKYMITK